MSTSSVFPFCHDDLDPQLPYLGPFEHDHARMYIQPDDLHWLVHWYAFSAFALIDLLKGTVEALCLHAAILHLVNVPEEFETEMFAAGLQPAGEFVDAWIEDLQHATLVPARHYPVRAMLTSELMTAAKIIQACPGQTRGFHGSLPRRIQKWIQDPNNKVFFVMDGDRPVGVLSAGLHGFDHARGPVCWLGDIAVLPSFQNRGLGRELLLGGLKWGLAHGARRANLSVNVQEEKALHLYEAIGFQRKMGRGEINLQYRLP